MSLVLAGIDEAGYGPLLGPLSVGMSVFRVAEWSPDQGAPDLWQRLARGVCRKAADKRRRVAIEDSKKLKLANSSETRHPLTHLERGVLAFLGASGAAPASDLELFGALGADRETHPWYAGSALPVPVAHSADQISIASNEVALSLHEAGVESAGVYCRTVGEREFNDTVDRSGTKAATTELAMGAFLRLVWARWAGEAGRPEGGPRVVCDRQGGRTDYAPVLARLVPGSNVRVLDESARGCRYRLGDASGRDMTVLFLVEAESKHLPVALASMTAKYVRELMMARFNAYWCGLCPELKPTAGYTQDARRWLRDAANRGLVDQEARRTMVRRA